MNSTPITTNNVFDAAISEAVIHHLNTFSLRKQAISELIRCVKSKGYILITNWAFENNKFQNKTQHTFIPFRNCREKILAN